MLAALRMVLRWSNPDNALAELNLLVNLPADNNVGVADGVLFRLQLGSCDLDLDLMLTWSLNLVLDLKLGVAGGMLIK